MKKYLLLGMSLCFFAACNKNVGDVSPINSSEQKTLMDRAWQMKAYMVNPDISDTNSAFVNEMDNLPDCVKDDYWIFNSKTIVSRYDHYLKCNSNTPDTLQYSYSLSNNEKYLTIWSNPDDPQHSIVLQGNMTYPSADTFILEFQTYNSTTKITSDNVQTYVKIVPN